MSDTTKTRRIAPATGTARLGVASGFFTLFAAAGAIATVGLGRAVLTPPLGPVPTKLIVALAGALSLTFGCLRTSWLLDHRRQEGVATAAIFVAAPLCGYFAGTPPTGPVVVAAVAGLAILASVWRHLEP